MNIVVLNYGLGNVCSVVNALRSAGANAEISNDEHIIMRADGIVIPGVGAFPRGMANLLSSGLVGVVKKYVDSGRPVLGICLGMQLLFERGTEFTPTKGLNFISGSIDIIPVPPDGGRLPHIAWSYISPTNQGRQKMYARMSDAEMRFYFVHSYAAMNVDPEKVTATVDYLGKTITASVQSGNIWGTQFHPEKSGPSGLNLLKNFIDNC
jgi:glutamine amidotransferase